MKINLIVLCWNGISNEIEINHRVVRCLKPLSLEKCDDKTIAWKVPNVKCILRFETNQVNLVKIAKWNLLLFIELKAFSPILILIPHSLFLCNFV